MKINRQHRELIVISDQQHLHTCLESEKKKNQTHVEG